MREPTNHVLPEDKYAQRLKEAIKIAQVGIWEWDLVENNLFWNDTMYDLYGVSPDSFSGAYDAWESGLHPEDKERGNREIDLAIRGVQPFDTEFRVLWPCGTVRYIKAIARVECDLDGNPAKMLGTNWDITAQKEFEKLLHFSNQRNKKFEEILDKTSQVAKIGAW